MPHELLDPRRLAMLHALGLQQVWVPRDALSEAERADLLPAQAREGAAPAPRQAPPAAGAGRTPAARTPVQPSTPLAPEAPAARAAEPRRAAVAPAADLAAAQPPVLPEQRVELVSGLGWQELRQLAHDCRACKLGGMRHQAVFGVGHAQARVMVVGEAPGAEEDRQGEPFVGAAGKLLDNMLRACGLQREGDDPASTVYIANVIKCRPPGNRNPEPDEVAQCLPILLRQIELVRPRLLLALGRVAAQALTGSAEPIGRLRQRAWNWRGTPLVVSYHPAYLLRTPQDKAKAWVDLCRAQDLLDGLER